MKDTKRAKRREATAKRFNLIVGRLFAVNTAHETKDETKETVIKRIHCEPTSRRFDGLKNWKGYAVSAIHKREAVV